MHAALAMLLTDTVSHATYTGQDGYGAPTYAAAVTHPCRVEYKIRRITNAQGEERVSRARLFFDGDVVIGLRDKLVLEDETAPAIQLIYRVRDETGALDHVEVWI